MHFKAIVITVMALLLTMSVAQDTSALVPTFTGYAQKDCQDEIVRWAPGDVAADQCVIATGGLASVGAYFPMQWFPSTVFTHWMPDCPRSDFRETHIIPQVNDQMFTCINAEQPGGTHSFWYHVDKW